jgi:hypothetical protein
MTAARPLRALGAARAVHAVLAGLVVLPVDAEDAHSRLTLLRRTGTLALLFLTRRIGSRHSIDNNAGSPSVRIILRFDDAREGLDLATRCGDRTADAHDVAEDAQIIAERDLLHAGHARIPVLRQDERLER